MRAEEVRNPIEALDYLTDCQLATVARFAMLKTPHTGEAIRAVGIAQKGCDWLSKFNPDIQSDTRWVTVVKVHGGSVARYAQALRNKFQPGTNFDFLRACGQKEQYEPN